MGCDDLDPRWAGTCYDQEHWHFHRQLLARYGVVLAPGEFAEIVRQITSGDALMVEKREGPQAIYWVRLPVALERVFILASGARIITAWPVTKELTARRKAMQAAQRS